MSMRLTTSDCTPILLYLQAVEGDLSPSKRAFFERMTQVASTRRCLPTIDPQGERIEIKGETNSTSHNNADTGSPSPVPERERKLCPPFFCASKRIVICS